MKLWIPVQDLWMAMRRSSVGVGACRVGRLRGLARQPVEAQPGGQQVVAVPVLGRADVELRGGFIAAGRILARIAGDQKGRRKQENNQSRSHHRFSKNISG